MRPTRADPARRRRASQGKGNPLLKRPNGLAIAVLAGVVACLAWAAAAGATSLPTVQGPAISGAVDSNPFGPCLFRAQGFNCYGPDEISAAYDYPARSQLDGTGQTIVIVDAYHHSLALRNLRSFDAAFGIPNPTTENFVAVDGPAVTTSGSGDVDGWGVDYGATWTPILGTTTPTYASYPASDPLVTGVGGTQGLPWGNGLLVDGHYGGEQAWNEPLFDAATGGAPSALFSSPPWQRSASAYKTRSVTDVSYNAAINGGVYLIHTVEAGGNAGHTFIYLVGGTSAGSPQWAAIFALANEARGLRGERPIGWANASLAKIGAQNKSQGAVHDITNGDQGLDSPSGFAAGPGFDLATGWGTPDVSNLIAALVNAPAASSPDAGAPAHLASGATTGQLRPHTMVPGG